MIPDETTGTYMRKILAACFTLIILQTSVNAQPVRIIYDTDMGNDVDDALALAMIHAFASRGEADLLAVTVTKDNKWAAPYIDVVNTFYGRGGIPIGVVRGGKTPEDNDMTKVPVNRRRDDGSPVYPHTLLDGGDAPDAVVVLREALAAAEDESVTVIQVGFSTNLARLLDSEPDEHSSLTGRELIRQKVGLLSIMAGQFPDGDPEYNVRTDIPSAKKLVEEWPTRMVFSGFEIGLSIPYPAASILNHYGYVDDHPVADAYHHYLEMPYDRPTWDLTSVLYAVRPEEGYFDLSESGRVTVLDDGRVRHEPDAGGMHQYLMVDDEQRARVKEALIYLASQPPDGERRD